MIDQTFKFAESERVLQFAQGVRQAAVVPFVVLGVLGVEEVPQRVPLDGIVARNRAHIGQFVPQRHHLGVVRGLRQSVDGSLLAGVPAVLVADAFHKSVALGRDQVGDPVAFSRNFEMLSKTCIHSKSLDDKIGAFVIAEAFRQLSKRKIKVGVACVGTVQEELGLRGAITGAFGVNPDAAIAVDVGFATDVPGIKPELLGDIKLGGGAELQRNADNNPPLLNRILKAAAKHKIPYQMTTGHRATGGTDTAAIQMTRGGVATALISIPNRYMHTPAEICDLRDVESAVDLIVETIASLTGKETFIPGID